MTGHVRIKLHRGLCSLAYGTVTAVCISIGAQFLAVFPPSQAQSAIPAAFDGKPEIRLYVAPYGKDSWSGESPEQDKSGTDGPLASLAGARDRIRTLRHIGKLQGPVRVLIRQAVYRLGTPLLFSPEDSGSPDRPITYEAYPGEQPVLSGGRQITGWRKEGNLWVTHIPQVISEGWRFNTLWVNGQRRQRARSPNVGYFHVAGILPGNDVKTSFEFHPGDLQPWPNLSEVMVTVYHAWESSLHRIASVDHARNVVTFTGPAFWEFGKWEKGQRYIVENTLDALDAPGEWYLDVRHGLLYYMPLPGEDPTQAEIVAPVITQLLLLQGRPETGEVIEHLRFKGLRLEHTDFRLPLQGHSDPQAAVTVPGAIQARGIRSCLFDGLEIAHLGTYALWLAAGSQQNVIANGHFHDLGAGGVKIGETMTSPSDNLAADYNLVYNNFIHDGGRIFAGAVGVLIGRSSNNLIRHNEIAQMNYTGISVGWTWGYERAAGNHNLIERNYIHHIGRGVLSDLGGIYTLGVSPGTILRYNVIHDVTSYLPTTIPACGIYLDEGSSYILVQSNLVYRTKGASVCQHYGMHNRIVNNILAYAGTGAIARYKEDGHFSFEVEHNIIYGSRPFLEGQWNDRLFEVDHNLYWERSYAENGRDRRALVYWQRGGHDIHSQVGDPQFFDPQGDDFRLAPHSPVFGLGFLPFDHMAAGRLYADPCGRLALATHRDIPHMCHI